MKGHLGRGGHGSSCDSPSLLSELWEVAILPQIDPGSGFQIQCRFYIYPVPGPGPDHMPAWIEGKGERGLEGRGLRIIQVP